MNVYIKKSLTIFLILILIIPLSLLVVACEQPDSGEKTITLVIGEGDNQKVFEALKTNGNYLVDALDELVSEGKLTYTSTDSSYGAYLTEINGITPSNDNYIGILTTVSEQQDITDWKVVKSYDNVDYVSAIYGISDLELIDGAKYMIALV